MTIKRLIFTNPPSLKQIKSHSPSQSSNSHQEVGWNVEALNSSGKTLNSKLGWKPLDEIDYLTITRNRFDISSNTEIQENQEDLDEPEIEFATSIPETYPYSSSKHSDEDDDEDQDDEQDERQTSLPPSNHILVAETPDVRKDSRAAIKGLNVTLPTPTKLPRPKGDESMSSGSSHSHKGYGGDVEEEEREDEEAAVSNLKVVDIDSDDEEDDNDKSGNYRGTMDTRDEGGDGFLVAETQDPTQNREDEDEVDGDGDTAMVQDQDELIEAGRKDVRNSSQVSNSRVLNIGRTEDDSRDTSRISVSKGKAGDLQGAARSNGIYTDMKRNVDESDEEERVKDSQPEPEEIDESSMSFQFEDTRQEENEIGDEEIDEGIRPYKPTYGSEENQIGYANGSGIGNQSLFNLTLAPPTPSDHGSRNLNNKEEGRQQEFSVPEIGKDTSSANRLKPDSTSTSRKNESMSSRAMKPFKSHSISKHAPPRLGMPTLRENKRVRLSVGGTSISGSLQQEEMSPPNDDQYRTNPVNRPSTSNFTSFLASRPNSSTSAEDPSMVGESFQGHSHSESMIVRAPKPALAKGFQLPQIKSKRALTSNNEKGRLEKEAREKGREKGREEGHEIGNVKSKGKYKEIEERDYTEIEEDEREFSLHSESRDGVGILKNRMEAPHLETQLNESGIIGAGISAQSYISQTQSYLSDVSSVPPPLNFDLSRLTPISEILNNSKRFTNIESSELVNLLVLITDLSGLSTTFNNESYFGELKGLDQSAPPISIKTWGTSLKIGMEVKKIKNLNQIINRDFQLKLQIINSNHLEREMWFIFRI